MREPYRRNYGEDVRSTSKGKWFARRRQVLIELRRDMNQDLLNVAIKSFLESLTLRNSLCVPSRMQVGQDNLEQNGIAHTKELALFKKKSTEKRYKLQSNACRTEAKMKSYNCAISPPSRPTSVFVSHQIFS
ncbi:unnamed protein product [Albugo candida]|uniref:Uncharacterized protein n=1 Tax=Albugo candida TaxID=65357 RepID=A0A024FXE5_9STRA|nr:unnamed protein product [Albugo candida]|eukprot:CCI11567.1 unnamed protein product [Albugo candida]